jgi:hypothetical protein
VTLSIAAPDSNRGIGEEELADSAPWARALVLQRLEEVWQSCQPHMNGDMGKPDPRFIEAGIRVLDRIMRLYRLDAPQAAPPEAIAQVDQVGMVEAGLLALEQKLAGS